MIYFVYVIVSILATFLGSITGMGGGGIMKPIFDAIGVHSATDIATITMFSTFAMAILSLVTTAIVSKPKNINYKLFIFIALGACLGGLTGKYIFNTISKNGNDSIIKIVQNTVFLILLIGMIIYLLNNKKIKPLNLKNMFWGLPVGFLMGIISGFLSIGGGQFNVPATMFFFGFDVKIAVLSSLTIILFSQFTNILTLLIQTGGSGVILSKYPYILLIVVICSLLGAFIGRIIAKKINLKNTKTFCIAIDCLIIGICIYNIIRYSLIL